jgi:hypothetical protein
MHVSISMQLRLQTLRNRYNVDSIVVSDEEGNFIIGAVDGDLEYGSKVAIAARHAHADAERGVWTGRGGVPLWTSIEVIDDVIYYFVVAVRDPKVANKVLAQVKDCLIPDLN